MHHWIWQHKNWHAFSWDSSKINELLNQCRLIQGKLLGFANAFDEASQTDINRKVLSEELETTSAIEGVALNRQSVRSSIAKKLNLEDSHHTTDRYIDGLLEINLDATLNHNKPLKLEQLCAWHAALFPSGYSHLKKISTGALRGEGDMEIISGPPNKPIIHYVAPPASQLPQLMTLFLNWVNNNESRDGLIHAAISHLWFELLHPFDDGNGRLGRTILEKCLANDEKSPSRFYSLSKQILKQRKTYYDILNKTCRGNGDITEYLVWFLQCFYDAIKSALADIQITFLKTAFWQHHINTELSSRQKKVLNKLLDYGETGFEGGMSTKKYCHITKTSRATAYRELKDLVEKNCLRPIKRTGRNASYEIIWPKQKNS